MTYKQILEACYGGELPRVRRTTPLKYSKNEEGVITTIKDFGVAVRFDGMEWDTWYCKEHRNDKRSRYISELELVSPNQTQ